MTLRPSERAGVGSKAEKRKKRKVERKKRCMYVCMYVEKRNNYTDPYTNIPIESICPIAFQPSHLSRCLFSFAYFLAYLLVYLFIYLVR